MGARVPDWVGGNSDERPSNMQMEPTRPTGCAIMALRRAAHLQRSAEDE